MYPKNWDKFSKNNAIIEIYRAFLLNEYRSVIFNIIKEYEPNKPNLDIYKFFINWILHQYNFEQLHDPLIPTHIDNDIVINHYKLNMLKKETKEALLSINHAALYNKLLGELKNFSKKHRKTNYTITVGVNATNMAIFKLTYDNELIPEFDNLYYVTTVIKLPKDKYDELYKQKNNNDIIFCILIRYLAIASLGNQLAVHPNILDHFKSKLALNTECFASSINHHLPYFYSLFPDLEKHFGSKGRYFQSVMSEGVYTINPPFYIIILNLIVNKIFNELKNTNKELLFFVYFPVVDKYGAKYVKKHCVNYNVKPIRYVMSDKESKSLDMLRNSDYNIITKIFCNDEFSYYDYFTNRSAFVSYTYMFVLGVNVNKDKILSVINKTNYIY